MSNNLYYHKCHDCLTPFTSTEQHIDLCDCDGPVSLMGVVHGDKFVQTANRAPCDGRCTHAHGPVCDCMCSGANHGTGRMVSVVVKEGKIKVVSPDKDIYEDMVRGYKYRELRDFAEGIIAKEFELCDPWIGPVRLMKRELSKIKDMRVYDRRQQEIVNFIAKYYKA